VIEIIGEKAIEFVVFEPEVNFTDNPKKW